MKPSTSDRNIVFVAKGGGITFAGKMFLAGIRLVTTIILARLLGADQYGMYSLALSAANIAVGLAVFGLDSALVRYVAILASRQDEKGVWGALQIGIGMATFLSVVTGTLLYALAYPVAQQLFQEPELAPLLQLMSVIVPLLTLSDVLAGANRGFKRMEYPVIAQFVSQPIIRLFLILILLFNDFNTVHAIITFGLADMAASFLLLYFLNREFALKRPFRDARRDVKEIFRFALPVWLSEMMAKFRNNIQLLIIGTLHTVSGVGIFSLATQLTLVGSEIFSSINTSAKPVIAELHDRRDWHQMGQIYKSANKWVVMIQLPVFLIMVLFPKQILSMFGMSFTDGAAALAVLAFAHLVKTGTGMGGIIIDMTGYTNLKLVNSFIRSVLYLGLDILLIPRWGLMGAAVAALIGEGLINLIVLLEVFFLFRLLPFNKSFMKPVTAALLACLSFLLLGLWLPVEASIPYTIVNGAVVLAVYAGMNLAMGLSPHDRIVLGLVRQRARAVIFRS